MHCNTLEANRAVLMQCINPIIDEVLDYYEVCNDNDTIIGKGKLGDSHVVVCKRPDAWGKGYDDVLNMAKTISDYINLVCK